MKGEENMRKRSARSWLGTNQYRTGPDSWGGANQTRFKFPVRDL